MATTDNGQTVQYLGGKVVNTLIEIRQYYRKQCTGFVGVGTNQKNISLRGCTTTKNAWCHSEHVGGCGR